MALKKILQNLVRAHFFLESFLTVGLKQRKHDACFLNPVKRKRSEKTVVELVSDAHLIIELCQLSR
jgi:hypothetical protein